jgi:uncharacterized protein (DUF4415 family)
MKPTRSDLKKVRAMSEEDVQRAALADPDAQPWTDEDLGQAVMMRVQDLLPKPKEPVSMRIDAEVLRWYKAKGKGWQTLMNAVLKAYAQTQDEQQRPAEKQDAPKESRP